MLARERKRVQDRCRSLGTAVATSLLPFHHHPSIFSNFLNMMQKIAKMIDMIAKTFVMLKMIGTP